MEEEISESSNMARQTTSNLVEKIKMAFSNDNKRYNLVAGKLIKKRTTSEDEDIDQYFDSPPIILSRQSTHYNPLNGILEESTISDNNS